MSDPIERVRYFRGQFLRTQEFVDEQAYHMAMRRRHAIAHHTWGIVFGLEVVSGEDGVIRILPGLAVDGYGRELIFPYVESCGSQIFDDKGQDALDIYLVYERVETAPAPEGYDACDSDETRAPYRMCEYARLEYHPAGEEGIDRRKNVPDVSSEDIDFPPCDTPPDDPTRRWPVFLGRIERRCQDDQTTLRISLNDRPYAGLRGDRLVPPWGDYPRLSLHQNEGEDTSTDIFSIDTEPGESLLKIRREKKSGSSEITKQIDLNGTTRVTGDLQLRGGAVQFGVIDQAMQAANAPAIYHTSSELCMVIGPDQKLFIGMFDANEKNGFKPVLEINKEGNVVVHGNLIVQGSVFTPIVAPVMNRLILEQLQREGDPKTVLDIIQPSITAINVGYRDLLGKEIEDRPEEFKELVSQWLTLAEIMPSVNRIPNLEKETIFAKWLKNADDDLKKDVLKRIELIKESISPRIE